MAETKYSDINRNLETENQDIKIETNVNAINNAITNILTIMQGQVPGRPRFFSNLNEFIFELMDDVTFAAIEELILKALEEFEPRIKVLDVKIDGYHNEQIIIISIKYEIITTGDVHIYRKTFEV